MSINAVFGWKSAPLTNKTLDDRVAKSLQEEYYRQLNLHLKEHDELCRNGTYPVSIIVAINNQGASISVTLIKQRLKNTETGVSAPAFQGNLMARICTIRARVLSFLAEVALRHGRRVRDFIECLGEFSTATYYRWRKSFMTWWESHKEVSDLLENIIGKKVRYWVDALAAFRQYEGTSKEAELLAAFSSFNA